MQVLFLVIFGFDEFQGRCYQEACLCFPNSKSRDLIQLLKSNDRQSLGPWSQEKIRFGGVSIGLHDLESG